MINCCIYICFGADDTTIRESVNKSVHRAAVQVLYRGKVHLHITSYWQGDNTLNAIYAHAKYYINNKKGSQEKCLPPSRTNKTHTNTHHMRQRCHQKDPQDAREQTDFMDGFTCRLRAKRFNGISARCVPYCVISVLVEYITRGGQTTVHIAPVEICQTIIPTTATIPQKETSA